MFIFMMFLYALVVIALLIQFKMYGHYPKKESSADTSITEDCDTTIDESSGLQLALREEVTVYES